MVLSKKVLIVDDDEILLNMYKERLLASNYNIAVAKDGEEGLKMVGDFGPDVVLLDIMMPKISGFDVLTELKKNEKTKDIPVIILTALSQDNDRKKGMDMGATDFIVKAEIMPKDVIKKIESAIKK